MKIVLVGSGHVATVLARKMTLSGHRLVEVNSLHEDHAKILAEEMGCRYSTGWKKLYREGDLYLFAISDRALAGIGTQFSLQDKLTVHTAGSVSKEALRGISLNYGVLYPMQSLRKEIRDLPEIPFLVDGNTQASQSLIYEFGCTLSSQVRVMGDDERFKLHLASVIVNNFTNHLYALAESFCLREKLEFDLLFPLILETAKRVEKVSPWIAQTGPAKRRDESTLVRQIDLLAGYPELQEIYLLLTRSIQNSG
jgi:predicted short-subunit dehydrogenase-like oxidoreductase (DUF2520 family)